MSSLTTTLAAEEEKLLACVHCGLCLEACPTYVATGDENDSPRGRIYLMRAVQEGRLTNTSSSFERHIDRCLGCRACEQVCPAGVEYGRLLEAARAEILQTQVQRGPGYEFLRFVLRSVWLKPGRLRAAFWFARLIRNAGIARILLRVKLARRVSPNFEFALGLLQGSSRYRLNRQSARGLSSAGRPGSADILSAGRGHPARLESSGSSDLQTRRATVLLFKGCVTDGLFRRVNEAAARVLDANGSSPETPRAQVCCGALHAHAGDLDGARALARQNIDAFSGNNAAPIITTAGGCGAMLVSYAHLLADDQVYAQRAREFSTHVRDISQQLGVTGIRRGAGLGETVTTYDASCHLLHGQKAGDAPLEMLGSIPELNFVPLEGSEVCCGGAGVYNLLEPDLSERVLAEKLKHIRESGAEVLTTGNAGCQMQIATGAGLAEIPLRVCHPVELLDESYRRAGFYDRR
jgi:glycolate oxidase iron-sulfur subunit